jgi:uncharacterized protein
MNHYKVVVFGKGEAGKSTFIKTISPDAVNIEHKGRTVALDFGKIDVGGKAFHFYGTPGQARFDVVRDIISDSANKALMIFDISTSLDKDDHNIFKEVNFLNVPFFAIINMKKGLPLKLKAEDVEKLCGSSSCFNGILKGDVSDRNFVHGILRNL